jgi:hypothetical protein
MAWKEFERKQFLGLPSHIENIRKSCRYDRQSTATFDVSMKTPFGVSMHLMELYDK